MTEQEITGKDLQDTSVKEDKRIDSSKKKTRKKESLEDILNAVAQKENVIVPFNGKKNMKSAVNQPSNSNSPLKFLLLQFCGGVFFAAGVLLVFALVFYGFYLFKEVKAINSVFYKIVALLRSFR